MDDSSERMEALLRRGAHRLTGYQRRLFMAEVTLELCGGSARRAERRFQWGRETVAKGLHELKQGIQCLDNFAARGRQRLEDQSKYDEGRTKATSVRDDFENFTVQENRGKALFVSNCAICHLPGQESHFSMITLANNGLDADYKKTDGGVGDITLDGREIGLFKSPSLRNVQYTAPLRR